MTSIECFEEALKESGIVTIKDVDDNKKLSRVNKSLFAKGLIKAMEENEDGTYLFYRGYLNSCTEDIAKYLCIFSRRTYIGAGNIDFGHTDDDDKIYYNDSHNSTNERTLKLYITFRELFKNQIAFFAPTSGYINDDLGYSESYDFITPLLNKNYKKVNTSDFQRVTDKMVSKLYVGLPWLKNARVEDYFEIVTKYHDYFLRYSFEVKRLAETTDNIDKFQYDLAKNIQEATIDLRIALEKKRNELITKGIVTTIGVCFTTMSILIPNLCSVINPEWLSMVFGGGTLYEFFNGATDINTMLNMCKDNTFFPIWEWNRKTERQKKQHWVYKEKL